MKPIGKHKIKDVCFIIMSEIKSCDDTDETTGSDILF
jgi:hypothetical protein